MRADAEIVEALRTIGYKAEHVSPDDDPAYTNFTKDKKIFSICLAIQVETKTIFEILDELG